MDNNINSLIKMFKIDGKVIAAKRYGNGHINATYLVKTTKNKYILQDINTNAFKDVDLLMNNINVVTNHIKNKGEPTIDLIRSIDDKLYCCFEGKYYRAYQLIDNVVCYETVNDNLDLTNRLGNSFGKFHHLLSDLDSSLIGETIKDFHNTPKRYRDFVNAYESAPKEKLEIAKEEIRYVLDHKDTYSKIIDGLSAGLIKEHITHNDPKINNILFNKKTKELYAVIDLDTVMPGSLLYDIGDAFRSLFVGEYEDSKDLSLININLPIFRAYMTGYLKEMKNDLTPREIELIPYSIYLLTIECGIRFLEDYLRGNVYFHVEYEEHNLVRCRTQIKLAEEVLKHLDEFKDIVKEILASL